MKSVLVSSFSLLIATLVAAGVFIWTGFDGDGAALSAYAHDGYYITEFRRDGH